MKSRELTREERLRIKLATAASQTGLKELRSGDDFLTLLQGQVLLGEKGKENIPEDKRVLIENYVEANLAGGDKLNEFIATTFRALPDSLFESPIVNGGSLTLAEVVALARLAVTQLRAEPNNDESHQLPLAA